MDLELETINAYVRAVNGAPMQVAVIGIDKGGAYRIVGEGIDGNLLIGVLTRACMALDKRMNGTSSREWFSEVPTGEKGS